MGITSVISASAIMDGRKTITRNEVYRQLGGKEVIMFTLTELADETPRVKMAKWYGVALASVGFFVFLVASLSVLGSGAYRVPALTITCAGGAIMWSGIATDAILHVYKAYRDNKEEIEEWQVNEWLEKYKAATNDSRVVVEYSMDCLGNQ